MMKKENFGFVLLAVLALMLAGCMSDIPSPLATPSEMIARLHPSGTPALTATSGPTATVTPQPLATRATKTKMITKTGPTSTRLPTFTRTPTPTVTSTLPPGPDLSLLFYAGASIQRYDLSNWSATTLVEFGQMQYSWSLSPDGQWLVYIDGAVIKIKQAPFDGEEIEVPIMITSSRMQRYTPFIFSPDSSLLVFPAEDGLKLLKRPFNGPVINVHRFIVRPIPTDDGGQGGPWFDDLTGYDPLFSPDSRFLLFNTYQALYRYDIEEGKTTEIAPQNETYSWWYQYFVPERFSPDGEWALVKANTYNWYSDHTNTLLIHLPSGASYFFDHCHRLGEWSADGLLLPVADHCAKTAGLSLITTYRGSAVENMVYQFPEPDAEEKLFYTDQPFPYDQMTWNAEGSQLYFTERTTRAPGAALMRYDRGSGEVKELARVNRLSYTWDPQGYYKAFYWFLDEAHNRVFYTGDNNKSLISLDLETLQAVEIAPAAPKILDIQDIPGTDWLMGFVPSEDYYLPLPNAFYLVHKTRGDTIRLIFQGPAGQINFLGVISKH